MIVWLITDKLNLIYIGSGLRVLLQLVLDEVLWCIQFFLKLKLTTAEVGLKSFWKLHKAPDNRHTLKDLSFDPVTKRSPLGLKAPQLTKVGGILCKKSLNYLRFSLTRKPEQ